MTEKKVTVKGGSTNSDYTILIDNNDVYPCTVVELDDCFEDIVEAIAAIEKYDDRLTWGEMDFIVASQK